MKRSRKPSRKPNSTYWRNKADALWAAIIHAQPEQHCLVNSWECRGRLEAHHLISRRITHLRHVIQNGVILCSFHHKFCPWCSPHAGPLGFARWLEVHRPDLKFWVDTQRKHTFVKPDYEAIAKALAPLAGGMP